MKRMIFIFILTLVAAGAAQAQHGLAIASLFGGRYKHSPHATEIVVTGPKAERINLDVYRSLSVTDRALVPPVVRAVTSDGSKAVSKEVEYRQGRLYYGYYVLSPRNGNNRFIFYLDQSLARKQPANVVTLIYMEGDVSSAYIKKLIKQ